jgi:hypothetical protein
LGRSRRTGGGAVVLDEQGNLPGGQPTAASEGVSLEDADERMNPADLEGRELDVVTEDGDEDEEDDEDAGEASASTGPAATDPAADLAALRTEHEKAQADLKVWNEMQEAAARDPVGVVRHLATTLLGRDPALMQQFMSALGGQAPAAEPASRFDAAKYEPESDLERELLPNIDFIRQGPQYMQQVIHAVKTANEGLDEVYFDTLGMGERLAALEEHLGLDTEAFDQKAFIEALRKQPNADPKKLARETYGKAVRDKHAAKKQAGAARPETPRSGSGAQRTAGVKRGMTFKEAWDSYDG